MKNVLGIVRNNWTSNEKGYYFTALDFFDEVIYIDPREVTYVFPRGDDVPTIRYNGFLLNDLSMLYVFGYQRSMLLLVQSLTLCGCPISDSYETLSRKGIGKVGERLTTFKNHCATTSYVLISYRSAKRFFDDFPDDDFPLVTKPIFGSKGRGIEKLTDHKSALRYLRSFFSNNGEFIILESFMNYKKEWRVYVVDGEILFSYEKKKPAGSFLANVHQSGTLVATDSKDREIIYDFVQKKITDEYRQGNYGLDVALTDKGALDIIEINRTPGWKGLQDISPDFIFPIEVHKRLFKRARLSSLPEENKTVNIVIAGDTYFGESYQAQQASQGKKNILETNGYDYCLENFNPILAQSDLVIANLESPITNIKSSSLEGKKEYIHWSDLTKTPQALKKNNIHVVSLANDHAIDYGHEGLMQTLKALEQHNIAYLGAGPNKKEASRTIEYDVKLGKAKCNCIITAGHHYRNYYDKTLHYYATAERGGANPWSLRATGQEIQDIRQKNSDAFIVAYPHWGANYQQTTEDQKQLAYLLIDSGADLVIGHGSHMMQGMEQYKGRWIVYGLGNFVVNSLGRYKRMKAEPISLIARLHFSENKGSMEISMRLYPIYTDNRVTNYKSYFVTGDQVRRVVELLIKNSSPKARLINKFRLGKDEIGNYLVFDLLHEKHRTVLP